VASIEDMLLCVIHVVNMHNLLFSISITMRSDQGNGLEFAKVLTTAGKFSHFYSTMPCLFHIAL